MPRLSGKVALVTGAARGMGRSTAELFASHGATVVATDVLEPAPPFGPGPGPGAGPSPEAGPGPGAGPEAGPGPGVGPEAGPGPGVGPGPDPDASTGTDTGGGIEFVRLDVTDEEDWRRVVAGVLDRYGRLDVLINNAGIIAYEPLHDLDLKDWSRVIDVNQTGVFLGMREAVPAMRRGGSGSIVNFSSIWGNVAVGGAHAYHATKGAVRNMTKNAAMTYAGEGIRVNSVHPGFIDTPLTAAQDPAINTVVIGNTPMGRAGRPEEVAYGCLFLASDESSFVTGAELVIDGGYLAQ